MVVSFVDSLTLHSNMLIAHESLGQHDAIGKRCREAEMGSLWSA